jgi:hypothetical protein
MGDVPFSLQRSAEANCTAKGNFVPAASREADTRRSKNPSEVATLTTETRQTNFLCFGRRLPISSTKTLSVGKVIRPPQKRGILPKAVGRRGNMNPEKHGRDRRQL